MLRFRTQQKALRWTQEEANDCMDAVGRITQEQLSSDALLFLAGRRTL